MQTIFFVWIISPAFEVSATSISFIPWSRNCGVFPATFDLEFKELPYYTYMRRYAFQPWAEVSLKEDRSKNVFWDRLYQDLTPSTINIPECSPPASFTCNVPSSWFPPAWQWWAPHWSIVGTEDAGMLYISTDGKINRTIGDNFTISALTNAGDPSQTTLTLWGTTYTESGELISITLSRPSSQYVRMEVEKGSGTGSVVLFDVISDHNDNLDVYTTAWTHASKREFEFSGSLMYLPLSGTPASNPYFYAQGRVPTSPWVLMPLWWSATVGIIRRQFQITGTGTYDSFGGWPQYRFPTVGTNNSTMTGIMDSCMGSILGSPAAMLSPESWTGYHLNYVKYTAPWACTDKDKIFHLDWPKFWPYSTELKIEKSIINCTKTTAPHYTIWHPRLPVWKHIPGDISISTLTSPSVTISGSPVTFVTNTATPWVVPPPLPGIWVFTFTWALATVNTNTFDYLGRMNVLATNLPYTISWLQYLTAPTGGGTKIVTTVKMILRKLNGEIVWWYTEDLATGWSSWSSITLTGAIVNLNIDTVTDKQWSYRFEFLMQWKDASNNPVHIGMVNIPLVILPTNNMRYNGNLTYVPSLPVWQMYANDTHTGKICFDVSDEFGNTISSTDVVSALANNYLGNKTHHNYQIPQTPYRTRTGAVATVISEPLSRVDAIPVGIKLDQYTNAGEAVTVVDRQTPSDTFVRFENSQVCFEIRSKTPDNRQLQFSSIYIPTHHVDHDITPNGWVMQLWSTPIWTPTIRFDKPFTGALAIHDDTEFKVGTTQTMRLDVTKYHAICPNCSDAYTINEFQTSLISPNPDFSIIEKALEINQATSVPSTGLFRKVTPWNATKTNFVMDYIGTNTIQSTTGIAQSNPWISYSLGGQTVRYRLTPTAVGATTDPVNTLSIFRGLRSLWGLQGNLLTKDKQVITGQDANTTNVSRNTLRNYLLKNVALITRSRQPQTILWCNNPAQYNFGTCYIVGDVVLNAGNWGMPWQLNQNYETLIIKNGNLTILGSGAVLTKNLGIILLNDDLSLWTSSIWNVYIGPDVTYIKSFIYADGGVVSVHADGSQYLSDSPERTKDLSKQLTIEGSLFTKNTIGWAIGGSYSAPGISGTSRFDALQYDLNFLRRGTLWWDQNNNGVLNAWENNQDALIIKYNPVNITHPLRGFENMKY